MSHTGRPLLMRGSALIAGILAACFASGCTVRSLEDVAPEQSVNQCEASADCRGGRCVNGQCVALKGEIEKVLLEVVPPMVAGDDADPGTSISSVRYLVEQELPETTSTSLGLELRPIVHVTGSVDYSYIEDQGCELSSVDAVALTAHFTPSEQLLGLPATTYTSSVELDALRGPVEFSLNVPPGFYDIYLTTALEGVTCQPTPRLIRRKAIGVSADENALPGDEPVGDVQIPFTLAPPATLKVTVEWPQDSGDLSGWTLAMIDGTSGLLLSGDELVQGYDGRQYIFPSFLYSPVEYATGSVPDTPSETELLRLAPPIDAAGKAVAPTLYAARIGLELFAPNEATIVLERLPKVVKVVGQVRLSEPSGMTCEARSEGEAPAPGAENACAVPFSVQVISTSDDGQTSTFNDSIPKGIFATYQTTVETEPDLKFLVDVPEGEYRAIAFPAADAERPWAIGEDAWILGSSDAEVHGKTVSVIPRARIVGRVLGAGSGSVSGFAVNWSASPEVPRTILDRMTHQDPPTPRATAVSTGDGGTFLVYADAGVFNLTVKPEAESGFAWLVKPNITVRPSDVEVAQDLGDLRLPLPVRYHGTIKSLTLGAAVPGALIRAYVYLDADGALTADRADAKAVIQVGEARADDAGEYELLLPSELSLDP